MSTLRPSRFQFRLSSRHLRAGAVVACAAALSACYVVPIDPHTGRPLRSADPVAVVPAGVQPMPPMPAVMQARLYPMNEVAQQAGMLVAQVHDGLNNRGTFALQYRGAPMQGESTRVDANYTGFGRIHQQVLGGWGRDTGGRRGIANAYSSSGMHAACEYQLTGPDNGTGACLFSDGAKYQMHFGQ